MLLKKKVKWKKKKILLTHLEIKISLGTITDAMLLKKLPFEAECHNQGHFAKST